MEYLLESIKQNQSYMVAYFLKDIPPEHLKTIYMSVSAVERTNLHILRQLQNYGVPFSDMSKAVFEQKEHHFVGLKRILGIFLCKFTDFLKELLFNDRGIHCHRAEESGVKNHFCLP